MVYAKMQMLKILKSVILTCGDFRKAFDIKVVYV